MFAKLFLLDALFLLRTRQWYSRKDESVAVDELWVLWVKRHEFVEQDVSRGCQALRATVLARFLDRIMVLHTHRGTGMATVRLEGGIDLKNEQLEAVMAGMEG